MLLQRSDTDTSTIPHVVTLRLSCGSAGVVVTASAPEGLAVEITAEYITCKLPRTDLREVRFVFLDPLGGTDVGMQAIEATPADSADVDGNAVTMPMFAQLVLRLEVEPPSSEGKKKLPKIPHDTTLRVRPKGGDL